MAPRDTASTGPLPRVAEFTTIGPQWLPGQWKLSNSLSREGMMIVSMSARTVQS